MVVVDRLTKISRFLLTITTIIAYGVIWLFVTNYFWHHKISRKFISDRDRKFVSECGLHYSNYMGLKLS